MNRFCLLLLASILVAAAASGGENPRTVRAVRITTPPRIDGTLSDEVWRQAEPTGDFLQRDPDEGQPASERTEIRVLYDDEALYFGCMYYDREPEKIVSRLTRRDDEAEADHGSIRIDSYHDHQTAYEFTFNVSGVKIDIISYDDGEREDDSWDPVWDLQTSLTPEGWIAEVKIPFRILRYKDMSADSAQEDTWGIQFFRTISRRQESDRWAFTPKRESGFVSRFGHLTGLHALPNPARIEALPFVVGRQRYAPADGALRRTEEFLGDAGLDFKYGISSNFLLDATVNPDFGQVEADPAVLNLTAFETFYPEKRPFFIEGTQILRFTTFGGDFGPGMFYSRRIGRGINPGEADPRGGYIESIPQNTTILGAAKLTGKTNGGLSIGVLEAATKEERAVVVDAAGNRSEQIVEPFANYNLVRLKQDVMTNSNVGMILTATTKRSRAPAFTNGYDWNLVLGQNTYRLGGFLALSSTMNRSNERVYGSAGKVSFNKFAGEHWLWSVSADYTSKKYNINDVGFFFSPDDRGYVGSLTYKEDQPGTFLRNYTIGGHWHQRWDFDGYNMARSVSLGASGLFTNYWSAGVRSEADFGKFDMFETRRNGRYAKPVLTNVEAELRTDTRHPVVVLLQQEIAWDDKNAWGHETVLGAELKPVSWMSWEVNGSYERVRDKEAWGRNSAVTGRSIFGDRSTDQYNFVLRNTTTFTRDLTLQLYTQVFLAKGHYENPRQLVGTSDFIPVDAREPVLDDFNEHAFHTNVVLRWEYQAGSTLYLVWSHARQGALGDFRSSFSDDMSGTFRIPPANVLLLKVNYWLSVR